MEVFFSDADLRDMQIDSRKVAIQGVKPGMDHGNYKKCSSADPFSLASLVFLPPMQKVVSLERLSQEKIARLIMTTLKSTS